jgi:hypothetical protein
MTEFMTEPSTLETFANPAPERDYTIRMTIPGVHLPVPENRPAGFRHAQAGIRSRRIAAWS